MVLIDVGIWLFNISRCGYFNRARASKGAPAEFGDIQECLDSLAAWTAGRRLSETSTFGVVPDSETSVTYFLCLRQAANGDFLLGLWNKIQTNSNKIASVGVNDVVGSVATKFTEIDEDRIPGYATYFYIMPAERKVATVRVKHPMNGLRNFSAYLSNFVRYVNPKHVVIGPAGEGDAIAVVGYQRHPTDDEVGTYQPQFRVSTISKPGETAYLVENSGRIRKAICKTTVDREVPDVRVWWQRGMAVLGLGAKAHKQDLLDEVVIKAEIPMTFERAEIEQIVQDWTERQAAGNEAEDDIGFVLQGESAPRWLGKSYARKPIEMEVQWLDEELVDPDALLGQLVARRATILGLGT
jgi:hypothetical protein